MTKRAIEPLRKQKKKAFKVDPISVAARVERQCLVKPCNVIATYDAATPRMQIIEDVIDGSSG